MARTRTVRNLYFVITSLDGRLFVKARTQIDMSTIDVINLNIHFRMLPFFQERKFLNTN